MAFRLYDDPSAGNLIGTPLTPTVMVTNGLFTQALNFGSNAFTGEARWLDVRVKCGADVNFTTLSRQPLSATPYALALPGLWTQPNNTSPNVIGGYSGNTIDPGTYGAVIAGGGDSGEINKVSEHFGTISGGLKNIAGIESNVGGGYNNKSYGDSTGGSTVGGGTNNSATGSGSTIIGGINNTASSLYAPATVLGGENNSALANLSTVGGYRAIAWHIGSFVWADASNSDFTSSGNNQFDVRATGGVNLVTSINVSGTPTSGFYVSNSGLAQADSLRVGISGTIFSKVQAGTATLGAGVSGVNVYTVTFPIAFSSTPKVIATIHADPGWNVNDTFAVSVRQTSATTFVVNVYRVDISGGTWSQALQIDWQAWQ